MRHALLNHAVDVAHRLYLTMEAAYKMNKDANLMRDLENLLLFAASLDDMMLFARSLENCVGAVHQLHHAARVARDLQIQVRDVRMHASADDVVRRLDDAVEWWRHFENAIDVASDVSFALDVARYVMRKPRHDVDVASELAIAFILEDRRDSRCSYCGLRFTDAEGEEETSCTT